jgi:hypothetical protein
MTSTRNVPQLTQIYFCETDGRDSAEIDEPRSVSIDLDVNNVDGCELLVEMLGDPEVHFGQGQLSRIAEVINPENSFGLKVAEVVINSGRVCSDELAQRFAEIVAIPARTVGEITY